MQAQEYNVSEIPSFDIQFQAATRIDFSWAALKLLAAQHVSNFGH
jgi:hypothetical protein